MSTVGYGGWGVGQLLGRSVLYEGVEDGVRENCLRVIETAVFSKLGVDMEFLYCVELCSFLWQRTIFIILFMGPYEWVSSIRCFAKLEVFPLLRHAVLCSL